MYCYEFPRPSVTVDIVLLTDDTTHPEVLLIRRKNPPYKDAWALPGGFLDMDETLEECALRELYEETNISHVHLSQVVTFGNPDRDPRGRVITVVYVGRINTKRQKVVAGSDAAEVAWFSTLNLPILAFDHGEIITKTLEGLK